MTDVQRDISFFLPGKAQDVKERAIIVSKRYVDEEGKVIPFILKPISTERIEELEKECQQPNYIKGRHVGNKLNTQRWIARIGIESTIYPNFKDKSFREAYKDEDAVKIAKKVLSVGGEYGAWLDAVQSVNKLDQDFEELVEEAKN